MDAETFIKTIRSGNEKLRVDDVMLDTGEEKLRGKGILRIEREKIEIDLTLEAGKEPKRKKNFVFKKDFWKLTGTINNHLRFLCETVSPGGSSSHRNGIVTITRRLNPIELEVDRFDFLTKDQKRQELKRLIEPTKISGTHLQSPVKKAQLGQKTPKEFLLI